MTKTSKLKTKTQRIEISTQCNAQRGFTLLELLLVIAIVAALAGLIINALNPAQRLQEANDAKSLANADDIEKALQAYILDNNGQYPSSLQTYFNLGAQTVSICKSGELCVGVDLTTELVAGGYLPNIPTNTGYDTATKSGYDVFLTNNSLNVEGPAIEPTFIIKDNFVTADTAPLVAPRTSEPGPGTFNVTDTLGVLSISDDKLKVVTGSGWGNPGMWGPVQTRKAGKGCITKISMLNTTGAAMLCFDEDTSSYSQTNGAALYINGSSLSAYNHSTENILTLAAGEYTLASIMRGTGSYYVGKVGTEEYKLLWVGNTKTNNLYPFISNNNKTFDVDTFRIVDFPAPWNSDYGIATNRLAGARPEGEHFVHEADAIIEFTITTLTSSGDMYIPFRVQDASNYWTVAITPAGVFRLYEVVGGVVTQRGTATAGIVNGHRIVLILEGTTIRGYSNNTLRWTYSSASNFSTRSLGQLGVYGTGGSISDLVTYPRTLSGPAAAALDKALE